MTDGSMSGPLLPHRAVWELLEAASSVVLVSAPAGTGKTFLVRAWIRNAGLEDQTVQGELTANCMSC
jgi:ATP/maltotriose-dependent transcriptional regulator MalT